MKVSDLNVDRLLQSIPEEGLLRLGDARVLLVEAAAMGVLRKALVEAVGFEMSRGIMTRFGFACGSEDARSTRKKYRLKTVKDWLLAGSRLQALQGHVRVEPLQLVADEKNKRFHVLARWRNSYEATEYKRFFGTGKEPCCWYLTGYASGWCSVFLGRPALCVETECEGKGDPHCLIEIRPVEDWGDWAKSRLPELEEGRLTASKSILEQTEGQARESERKYRQLYDVAADMMLLSDPETGRLADVNPASCRLLGYSREELLRMSAFDLLASPDELADTRRLFEEALRTGIATRISTFRRKDGSQLEAEVRTTPLHSDGRTWMLGIGRDLTAQRRLERRALAFYQAFLNSNDSMFYTDRNGVIQDVNEAFIRRFGYTREEAIGRSPRIVRSRHTPQALYRRLWGDILDTSKGFWRGRIIDRTKAGDELPVMLSATAVKDARGEIVGFVSSAVDMSEQEELHRRLTRNEALAAVGSMAAVVAHEIRNPLGSIVTAASSIVREGLDPKDREALLTVLRKESLRLGETLSQFLQYARPRELALEDGDINESVREVLSMVRSDPKLHGDVRIVERLSDALPRFPFDANALRQVLWNIIINALQALRGKGTLNVATESELGKVKIHIADTGPGIPKTQIPKIFQPFHTTKQKGTGLGLPIAESIVAAHGGQLTVDSDAGQGACFSIALPTEGYPEEVPPPRPGARPTHQEDPS